MPVRLRWVLIGCVSVLAVVQAASSASGAGILFQATFRQTGTGATDRSAMARLRDTVSIKDFGAVGDGSTDDAPKINTAISTIGAAGGGTIFFPCGTYNLKQAIIIQYDNIGLVGSHWGCVTLKMVGGNGPGTGGSDDIIRVYKGVYPATVTVTDDILITNFTLDGNQASITHCVNDTYCNGINMNAVTNSRVTNNIVKNVLYIGINWQGTGSHNTLHNYTDHNDFTGFGEYAINVTGGTDDAIVEKNFVYTGATVAEIPGGSVGISISNVGQQGWRNKVQGNHIKNVPNAGISIYDNSRYTDVIGNTVDTCGTNNSTNTHGILLSFTTTSSPNVLLANNMVTLSGSANGGGTGISVLNSAGQGQIQIVGNKVADSPGGGIQVNAGTNIMVANNQVYNTGTAAGTNKWGIKISSVTAGAVVSQNMLDTIAGNGIEIAGTTAGARLLENNFSSITGSKYLTPGDSVIVESVGGALQTGNRTVIPPTDGTAWSLFKADASTYVGAWSTNGSPRLEMPNGTNLIFYSDSFSTNKFQLTGSTGKAAIYAGLTTAGIGLVPVGGTVLAQTGKTADLAATSVYAAAPVGEYRVCATARTTTSGTGTTATLNIIWTDEGGVKTDLVGTWALNSVTVTGQINKCEYIHAAAASNIQVSVTAGTYGTSVYAISATAERLN